MKSIEVVAAAIYKDGKVLAAQRGYGEFKGGWDLLMARRWWHSVTSLAMTEETMESS